MRVFFDTNIFIRFFTHDNDRMFDECKRLFALIEQGKLLPYTSNIVLIEIVFILSRLYKFPKKEVKNGLDQVLKLRNLTLIESTDTTEAMKLFGTTNLKLSDCYIAAQVPKDTVFVTYDSDFRKIPFLSIATPDKILPKN